MTVKGVRNDRGPAFGLLEPDTGMLFPQEIAVEHPLLSSSRTLYGRI